VVVVGFALAYREYFGDRPLAEALSDAFTVLTYDRRGRGESTDTAPYAVEREIEDIEALVDACGGTAYLYGASSGGALALRAAAGLGRKIAALAVYEPPYGLTDDDRREFAQYTREIDALLAAGKPGDAVARFLSDMLPADVIEEMRRSREWAAVERVAPTLAYDNAVLGDGNVPSDVASAVSAPTLVLGGGESLPFLRDAAKVLAEAMPGGTHRTLEGQTHLPSPETVAPVLVSFFGRR
jgi:pimeloyl-ACP methyl ester carboxylesterase